VHGLDSSQAQASAGNAGGARFVKELWEIFGINTQYPCGFSSKNGWKSSWMLRNPI
jgi:hypothetical protein